MAVIAKLEPLSETGEMTSIMEMNPMFALKNMCLVTGSFPTRTFIYLLKKFSYC
jgi:hypothetical protein